ncbi:hypothetical protein ACHAXR_013421 [Thalassiosira sp. AJA248-18]
MNASHRQGRSLIAALLLLLSSAPLSISAFSTIPRTVPSLVPPSSRHLVSITEGNNGRCSSSISRGSSSTALSALPLPSLASIGKFYKGYPLLAGFLTASTKAGIADSLAQYRDVCTTKFNIKRNLAMVMYSGTILGMTCEIMYNRLFPIIFGLTPGVERTVFMCAKMTLFDGFINAPLIWLPPAYIAQAIVYRYPIREAIQKYVTDVKENGLLKKYWSLWLPMSMINFCFVPDHFRVAFVASISFFWMIILSIVANNSTDQDPDSCPLEPEPKMLNPRALD